ncbi:MAG: putative DNA modification/repair radical SAM protein [Deltaproteobacteria bacterium]|jgi:putative DNA modification/repair radical SAM protein|nr:putative DNA modification/repair radical SAM protein [Deltaproteobacteria bacterium]
MNENTLKKLKILAESAKYDAACTSSGVGRANTTGGVGSAASWGCCHSFSEDGRCISLLKVLFTNHCIYDCAYCVNRRSNDLPRVAFGVRELAELTIEFYRRNYIEGLFLSSGVLRGPDHTMELIIRSLRELRGALRFNGYIHVKCIPGADAALIRQAGLLADRLSVNIEIPSEANLKRLAPEKDHDSVYKPMYHICKGVLENREERKKYRSAPSFAPAGQSTQMIIGASDECDRDILQLSSRLYEGPALKRVFYSGFVPVNAYDSRLPALKAVPLVRENRLYQADWLMRFYGFAAGEILDGAQPNLDLHLDPKIAWALRHPEFFPVDANRAEYGAILRVPGIGLRSARRIVQARRYNRVTPEHMKRMGVVMSRARFFLADLAGLGQGAWGAPVPSGRAVKLGNAWDNLPGLRGGTIQELGPDYVRLALLEQMKRGREKKKAGVPVPAQLSLFGSGSGRAAPTSESLLALPV